VPSSPKRIGEVPVGLLPGFTQTASVEDEQNSGDDQQYGFVERPRDG
jgi:hypothetical protein